MQARDILVSIMSWFFNNLVGAFLLPPLNLLLLAVLGLWLWHKWPFIARVLLISAVVSLWLLSTPFVAEGLLHELEGEPQATDTKSLQADAIVVLGGGTYFNAPEYGADTVNEPTLARLRFAARLQRETGKPILVSGGRPVGNSLSEAAQMQQVLVQEFNVPVQWVEREADNTFENAFLSREMLKQAGIKRVYLVTHAWHMARAVRAFRAVGLQVVPAPTAYTTRYRIDLLAFIPTAKALRDSRIFLHELVGILWYQLKS